MKGLGIENYILLIAFLAALTIPACKEQPAAAAANSAPPLIGVPVGPVPGPKTPLPSLKNPYENDSVAMAEGLKLFNWYNCSGCHGGHGGGGMGPSLRGGAFSYGDDNAHIFASISEGRGKGMPAWGTKIPEDQIWKLAAYIKSMNTPQEPDPPLVPPEPEARSIK